MAVSRGSAEEENPKSRLAQPSGPAKVWEVTVAAVKAPKAFHRPGILLNDVVNIYCTRAFMFYEAFGT